MPKTGGVTCVYGPQPGSFVVHEGLPRVPRTSWGLPSASLVPAWVALCLSGSVVLLVSSGGTRDVTSVRKTQRVLLVTHVDSHGLQGIDRSLKLSTTRAGRPQSETQTGSGWPLDPV